MLIQATKKLLDQLNIKSVEPREDDPLFSWHANLVTLNRRKAVILVNDKNRYVVVLYGLKAKDFKNLGNLILDGIRETFLAEGMKEEIIDRYINQSREIVYTRTKDRKSVARLNKVCETIGFFERYSDEESLFKTDLSKAASRDLVSNGEKDYIRPNEELYSDLGAFSGQSIFAGKAVKLRVSLELENQNVWRRVVIPLNVTFRKLHKVLQAAFGWKGYHLHEFYIYNEEKIENPFLYINHSGYHKEGYKGVLNIISDEEDEYYEKDIPVKFEKGIKLSEVIPKYSRLKYIYDFGDDWQHYIEVEEVIEDYEKNYPVCLEGEGNAPPEDVGGDTGYEEFLEILADPNHPEHELTVTWGRSQGYTEFDLEKVNRNISSLYIR